METVEILKFFIGKGVQLDKRVLDYLTTNQDKIESLSKKLDSIKNKPLVITFDFLQSIEIEKPSVFIIREFDGGQKPKSTQEVIRYFQNRFQKISKLLTSRLELTNLISINKITEKTKKFSIIGMVGGKNESENSLTIEDFTGETKIFFQNTDQTFHQINPDDILGFVCENENGVVFEKGTVFPDVPLKKEIQHTNQNISCYFVSGLNFGASNFNQKIYDSLLGKIRADSSEIIIFVMDKISGDVGQIKKIFPDLPQNAIKVFFSPLGGDSIQQEKNVFFVCDPCVIGVEDVKIFVSSGAFLEKYLQELKTPIEILLSLIRKRHLNPDFSIAKKIYVEDPYYLDTVPDIFAVGSSKNPNLINYKGMTILSTGKIDEISIFWKINLKTRENLKIDLR